MSSLDDILLGFAIDIMDIIISNDTAEQTVPEQDDFGSKTTIGECRKIDWKILDYPCTCDFWKSGKLMKNGGIWKNAPILGNTM